jgi:hypothetical protein
MNQQQQPIITALHVEEVPDKSVLIALLRGVKDGRLPSALTAAQLATQQDVLLLDPRSIVSVLQLHIAAATALQKHANGLSKSQVRGVAAECCHRTQLYS